MSLGPVAEDGICYIKHYNTLSCPFPPLPPNGLKNFLFSSYFCHGIVAVSQSWGFHYFPEMAWAEW